MSSVKITRISAYLLLIVVLLSVFSSGILGLALYQFNDDPVFYEPGLLVERYFEIHAADKDVKIWLDGPLSEYATVSKEILEEDSADRGFTVTLNFPYGADVTPGNYKIYVHTDEVTEERAGTFGTSVNILNGIRVLVIHPGKFLKIESYKIENVNVGETLNMGVWVSAFSQQDIDSAWAVFEIFDKDGNKMAEEATQRSTVKSRETVGLEAQTSTEGYEPGPYTAKITAFYEEGQSEAETSFQVGTLNVDILDYPTEIEARTINPLPMTIKSRWNDGIEDVYGELEIEGEKFSTPTIDLGGWKETTLEGFLMQAASKLASIL